MRADRPSFTAAFVSMWRGLGEYDVARTGHDEVARALVPPLFAVVLDAAARFPTAAALGMRALSTLTLGLSHHLPFRTQAIDEAVREAIAGGTRQLVLLGAGLDARAYRLEGLAEVEVFEVDFPSTQAYKQQATAAQRIAPRCRRLAYVAIDFLTERLGDRLRAAGFDPGRPAVFVWEGVTMYLDDAAVAATLEELALLAAPGSVLCVTYQIEAHPLLSRAAGVVFAALGEALTHRTTTAAFAGLLAAHGFVVERDEGDQEWAARYADGTIRVRLPMTERLAVAQRR